MKRASLVALVLLSAVSAACASTGTTDGDRSEGDTPGSEPVDGAGSGVARVGGYPARAGELVFAGDRVTVETYFRNAGGDVRIEEIVAGDGVYQARFSGVALERALDDLGPQLKFVEPNYLRKIGVDTTKWPHDPEFFRLWGMNNVGQASPLGLEGQSGSDLHLLSAWETTKGSREIVVAILDSGMDYTHPDLADNVWINDAEKGGVPGVDDDNNGFVDDVYGWDFVSKGRTEPNFGNLGDSDPMDENGHGTHVAGTIGAVANNGRGVVGVNWNVRLMPLRIGDSNGMINDVDAYRAFRYGTKMGVDVMSNSWGGGGRSQLLEHAIKEAQAKGILIVAAAGNDGADNDATPSYPANYAGVLSVGASDNLDVPAGFSNFGAETVQVFAPGVNVLSTYPVGLTPPGQEPYQVMSGTSMATPHASGVAALVLAADSSLRKKPEQLRARLVGSSDVVGPLLGKSVSNGRLNAARAVRGEMNPGAALDAFREEAHSYTSPSHLRKVADVRHDIVKAGAGAIRVHFAFIQAEPEFDSVYIYDRNWRLIADIANGDRVDYWSPVIPGDTVHVRFVNSLVQAPERVKKGFATVEEGLAAGGDPCFVKSDETAECTVDGAVREYANFNSEGFSIDKIAFASAQ